MEQADIRARLRSGDRLRGARGAKGRDPGGIEWRAGVFKVKRESKKGMEHEYAAWMGEGKTLPWL